MAAGLGFKTFTTGEVLTAGDVNGYLMQGINVFASSAARASAITSPQEGQYSFLKDTNALEYYDGAAWVGAPVGDITAVTAGTGISGGGSSGDVTITNSMATAITTAGDLIYGTGSGTFTRRGIGSTGNVLTVSGGVPVWSAPAGGGKVLQVVQATTSTQVINSTSTLADTGLTASITPSSATSTILVMVSQMGCMKTVAASTNSFNLRLYRGASDIAKIAGAGLDTATSLQQMASFTYSFIDSPATTSSTTYKTQFNNINNGASVRVQQEGEKSTIILMEIGA